MALEFTTLAKVRTESGFSGNANVLDADHIQPHADHADGDTLMAIAQKYALPLSDNSNYSESPAKKILEGITTSLASGYLLCMMFEGQGGDMYIMGKAKISEAKKSLRMIANGGIRLIGSDGLDLVSSSAGDGFSSTKNVNDPIVSMTMNL